MAQQTVNFEIAAHTKGMESIAKLINEVGVLQKEMKSLQQATANATAGFDKASQGIKGLTNPLDAQSKALRQQRQGFQQVGMQINDFATSISTGASFTTAFNQQIGQLGYAMSLMQGAAGRVGRFLAGPWGAAITIAAMALGPLIENMLGLGKEADKTNVSLKDLEKITQSRIDSETNIRLALAKTAQEYRAIQQEVYNTILQKHKLLQVTHAEISQNFALARSHKKEIEDLITSQDGARASSEMASAQSLDYYKAQSRVNTLNQDLLNSTAALETSTAALNAAKLNIIQTDKRIAKEVDNGSSSLKRQQERLESLTEKLRDYILVHTAATDEIGKTQKKLDDFNDLVKELEGLPGGAAVVKELATQIQAVRDSILNEGADKALQKFNAEVDKLIAKDLSPFEQSLKGLQDSLADPELGLKPEDTAKYYEAIQTSAASYFKSAVDGQQDLIDKARDVDRSYEKQLQSLRDIITVTAAAGGSTVELQQMLADFEAKHAELKIVERNAELQKSFEAIGTSVASAFQDMLTGAASWKEGMRGIIQAVINELFRLYVVQQIVGFVKGALSGAFGGGGAPANLLEGTPYKALGGSVSANTPYIVGEKGPELFMPSKSGTIIPNQNLPGGGTGGSTFNISVDARGSSDPEAVRQQVQQGILEAAPSIVAAAQNRTIESLRRPRLAGTL